MAKKSMEFVAFKDRIKQLDCVLETKINRKEIEAKLYCKNQEWGLPTELADMMEKETMGQKWCIVDFSHVNELEDNRGCNITVYLQPR